VSVPKSSYDDVDIVVVVVSVFSPYVRGLVAIFISDFLLDISNLPMLPFCVHFD